MKPLSRYAVLADGNPTYLLLWPGLWRTQQRTQSTPGTTELLKNGQQGIFRELKEIKDLLQGKRDAATADTRGNVLSIKGQPMKG